MDATSGHYVACILNNDKWYLFDGTNVTEVCETEVLKQHCFIRDTTYLKRLASGDVVKLDYSLLV